MWRKHKTQLLVNCIENNTQQILTQTLLHSFIFGRLVLSPNNKVQWFQNTIQNYQHDTQCRPKQILILISNYTGIKIFQSSLPVIFFAVSMIAIYYCTLMSAYHCKQPKMNWSVLIQGDLCLDIERQLSLQQFVYFQLHQTPISEGSFQSSTQHIPPCIMQ